MSRICAGLPPRVNTLRLDLHGIAMLGTTSWCCPTGIVSAPVVASRHFTLLGEADMATKLDKAIKRELVHGDKTYTITISPDGLKVVEKGKRNGRELSWSSIISGDATLNENLTISVDASRADN